MENVKPGDEDGPAEGDRGEVGNEPEGDDFDRHPTPEPSDQLPEEQPEPVADDS